MLNINFYLKSKKTNKSGKVPVIAQIAFNYKKIRKYLFTINPDHWDSTNQRMHLENVDDLTASLYTEYNKILDEMKIRTFKLSSRYFLLKRNIPERELLRLFYTDKQIEKLPRKTIKK